MIQFLPCPSCRQSLLLPNEVSPQASIACPVCEEQFVLENILESEFGYWRVVQDPHRVNLASDTTEIATATPGEVTQPKEPSITASDADVSKTEWSLQPAEPNTAPNLSRPKFAPISHEQFERAKRETRSPVWTILQVVVGGLAAVPISLLILWHILDKDIADAGPRVSKFAPWIVPPKFRGFDAAEFARPTQGGVLNPGESGFRQFRQEELYATDDPSPRRLSTADTIDSPAGPITDSESRPPETTRAASVPFEESADRQTTESNYRQDPETENIFATIQRCEKNLDAWRGATSGPRSELRSAAQSIYRDLTDLASIIDRLPDQNPVIRAIRDAMQPIGRKIKRETDVQDVIQQGAAFWVESLGSERRFPLAAVVEIQQAAEKDFVWTVTPTDSTRIKEIDSVTIPSTLAPSLISGQRLFLLGMVESSSSTEEIIDGAAPPPRILSANYLHAL